MYAELANQPSPRYREGVNMAASESARHSVSVAAVIVDESGHILAVRRHDNGHWEPPGGVLELNESIDDGLIREVHEETGLDITIEALTGAYKNLALGIVALVFRCRPAGGQPSTSAETAQLAWLTPDQVRDAMDEAYAVRVLDAIDPGPPRIRAHNGTTIITAGRSD
jgi:8-oxo-dGTP diphosphatase